MSFTSETSKRTYLANGSQTVFAYDFLIYSSSHLAVYIDGVLQVTGFTTDGVGIATGGNVTFSVAPTTGKIITLNLEVPFTQELDYQTASKFPATSHEKGLDLITMLAKRLNEVDSRALKFPLGGDTDETAELPNHTARASKYLAFNGDGNPVATSGTTSNIIVSTFAETFLDDVSSAATRTTLGFPAIAAKGDLIVGSAPNTLTGLTAGATTGHVLAINPATLSGLDYVHRSMPNPIINGNAEIWQRGTSALPSFGTDRFGFIYNGGGSWVGNRSTNVPTLAQAGVLFNYSLELDIVAADASLVATDQYYVFHKIEGYNWRHFAQRLFTLSFWVMSAKTGIHSVGFRNAGSDRTYVAEYTVSTADTWEFKTITVPASPAAGTWNYTDGIGLQIFFNVASGSNFTTSSLNTWNSNALYASVNQVNVMDSTTNFFRLTGIKMELGSVVTPIQFAPFETELARAMRYYQKSYPYVVTPGQGVVSNGESAAIAGKAGATQEFLHIPLPVRMRNSPTVTLYNPAVANAQVRDVTANADCSASTATSIADRSFQVTATGNASTAVGNFLTVHWSADAEL